MNNSEIQYLTTKNGEKFPYIYSLNVMKAIQKKYGSIDKWANKVQPKDKKREPSLDAFLFFFTEAINDGIDMENEKLQNKREFVDSRKVGRILTEIGLKKAEEKLKQSVINSTLNKEEQKNSQEEKN